LQFVAQVQSNAGPVEVKTNPTPASSGLTFTPPTNENASKEKVNEVQDEEREPQLVKTNPPPLLLASQPKRYFSPLLIEAGEDRVRKSFVAHEKRTKMDANKKEANTTTAATSDTFPTTTGSVTPELSSGKPEAKSGWQKFLAKFRRSREKRKVEVCESDSDVGVSRILRPMHTHSANLATIKTLQNRVHNLVSLLRGSTSTSAFQHPNPPQQPFRLNKVPSRSSTLPAYPTLAACATLLPFEDPLKGKEYSRTFLWELYNSMDEFLETVFSNDNENKFQYFME